MQTIVANFAGCQPGPHGEFFNAAKKRAFPDFSIYDADIDGDFFNIMNAGGPKGEPCLRMLYKMGHYGMNNQFFQLRVPKTGVEVSVEFDWMFELGADLVGDCLQGHNGGKIGPAIQMGGISGTDAGLRAMIWFQTNPKDTTQSTIKQFNPIIQDQRSGIAHNELIVPPIYYGSCRPGEWHHHKLTARTGPSGYVKHEYDRALISNYHGNMRNSKDNDGVNFDFAYFAGGNGLVDAPKRDFHARSANHKFTIG